MGSFSFRSTTRAAASPFEWRTQLFPERARCGGVRFGRTRVEVELAVQDLRHHVRRRVDNVLVGGATASGIAHAFKYSARSVVDTGEGQGDRRVPFAKVTASQLEAAIEHLRKKPSPEDDVLALRGVELPVAPRSRSSAAA